MLIFIVGIDIAKRSHVARIIDSEGRTVVKPFSIRNSCSGYNALLARMNKITNRKSEFILAMEATSHYWLALYTRLCRESYRAVLLNPSQTHAMRELRYVFDVSDTGGEEHTCPKLWSYREEHQEVVAAALAQRYGVPDGNDLPEQFEKIASQLAEEYWTDHQQDIIHIVDGSFLEEYDTFNIGVQFKNAAAVSIAYVLMSRCGLEPENYFEHEDFLSIFDFNTPATVTELGTAVSMGSETVLRQIEVTIKKYEREKSAERSADHGKQPDLHASGRLPAPRPDPGRTASPLIL